MALLGGLALCLGRGRIGSDLAYAVGGWEGGISPGDGLSIHSEKVRVCGGLKTCLGWENYHRFVCCFNSTVNGSHQVPSARKRYAMSMKHAIFSFGII